MGGGTKSMAKANLEYVGLSPRGRGNPRVSGIRVSPTAVYPRVGGGTQRARAVGEVPAGLSPRGRGNRPPRRTRKPQERSIPAWAGEPVDNDIIDTRHGVYPRVGGGTRVEEREGNYIEGLSPRGRGNPPVSLEGLPGQGSIPAWAGEPLAMRSAMW